MDGNALVTNVTNDDNDDTPSMDDDVVTQTQHHTTPQHNDTVPPNRIWPPVLQPPLPTLLNALAPPLPTLPANRTTSNADDTIRSNHITMDMGPNDDISSFILHIRRAADDAAFSSHAVTVGSATNVDIVAGTEAAADDTNASGA